MPPEQAAGGAGDGDQRRAVARQQHEVAGSVAVEVADASRFSEVDRYDVIAVSAALPAYDRRFERALRVGGRLFLVVGRPPVMFAKLVVRTGADEWVAENLFETEIDPMVNATAPSGFRF